MIFYFLPAILALGILTSYEDLKGGIISNENILAAFGISAFVHLLLLFTGRVNGTFAVMSLAQVGVGLFIGVSLWLMGYWSAGDAKLFAAFTALVPSYQFFQLPVDILINAVLPIFLYLVTIILFKTSAHQKLAVLKEVCSPKKLMMTLLLIFSMSWLIRYFFIWLNIPENYVLYIILIAGLYRLVHSIFDEQTLALLMFISLIRVFVNYDYIMKPQFIFSFVVITTGYIILMMFIGDLGKHFTKNVNVHKLKPGMVLLEGITDTGLKGAPSLVQGGKLLTKMSMHGLTQQEINHLRTKHLMGHIHFNDILVLHTIPFAPMLFIGCLLTIFLGGNVVSLLF